MKRDKCIVCSDHLYIDSVIIGDQYPSAVFTYENEDYQRGIYESKFIFDINKEIMTSCGCGISFSPKIN